MKFSNLEIAAQGVNYTYKPYDRGANGAFVFREAGVSVHAPRVVVSTIANDTSSDRLTIQLNTPVVQPSVNGLPESQIGTDLVKTEMRFLASTSKQDRIKCIDKQVALLQELRNIIEDRGVMYT